MHSRLGLGVGTKKIINVNISSVYEVICKKLCNLIPLRVKSHLKGRRALLIAPKQGFWVYEAICTKFCSLIPQITSNTYVVELEEIFALHLRLGLGIGTLKKYKCQYLWCL